MHHQHNECFLNGEGEMSLCLILQYSSFCPHNCHFEGAILLSRISYLLDACAIGHPNAHYPLALIIVYIFNKWQFEPAAMTIKEQKWGECHWFIKNFAIINVLEHGCQQFACNTSTLRMANEARNLLPPYVACQPIQRNHLSSPSQFSSERVASSTLAKGLTPITYSSLSTLYANAIAHRTGCPFALDCKVLECQSNSCLAVVITKLTSLGELTHILFSFHMLPLLSPQVLHHDSATMEHLPT